MNLSNSASSKLLLYVLHSGNLYGTERMALATLEKMDGYEQRIVVAPPAGGPGGVAQAARHAGHEAITFHGRLGLIKSLVPWFLKYRRIDVIGTGVVHSMLCHVLSKLFFVRLRQLHVAHGGTPTSFDRKRALNAVPVTIVAVSEFVRRLLVQRGVESKSISVIENFLSDSQREEYRRRLPYQAESAPSRAVDAQRIKVAVVSRVDAMKRIDLLIDAIERHGLGEFQFDVYGAGEVLDALRSRGAPLLNLAFHGYVLDTDRRLAEADFLLHLCPEEPFGLVILEAFAAGLVPIVPDAGGAGSLIEDDETGLKFAADDADAVATALRRAAALPMARLQTMAGNGAATLDGRFSQSKGVHEYQRALNATVA